MLRNNKGYLLLECLLALVLLTAVFSICLPFINKSFQEHKSSKQLLYAIEEVDLIAVNFSLNNVPPADKEWERDGIMYTLLTKKGATDAYKFCIVFEGSNEKGYETCSHYQ
jgi:hypothetical protein